MRPLAALLFPLLGILSCARAHVPVLVEPPNTHAIPAPVLIRGVAVFDGIGGEVVPGLDVLVVNGRIGGLAATGVHPPPEGVQVVEGRGRTLLPGLVDAHVRVGSDLGRAGVPPTPELQAEALLYGGVTSVATVGHDGDVEKLQARIADGALAGPRFHRSSRIVAGSRTPHDYSSAPFVAGADVRVVDSPKDAARAARKDFEYLRSDFATIDADALTPEAMRAVVAEAQMYRKSAYALAGSPDAAAHAAEARVGLLLQVPFERELSIEEAERIAFSNTPVVTTLSAWRNLIRAASGAGPADPLGARILGATGTTEGHAPKPRAAELERLRERAAIVEKNLLLLREVGAPLVAGSGAGLPGATHGASIHDELEALVALGIPPGEVLLMATSQAVRFLDPEARFGVIAPGAYADLLLVEGDPVADPSALRRIVAMWQAGIPLDRRAGSAAGAGGVGPRDVVPQGAEAPEIR